MTPSTAPLSDPIPVKPRRAALPLTQRSTRYHRPRAPFCGVGYCTNCLVRTPEQLNTRLCLRGFDTNGTSPTANAWPSVRFDLAAVLDLLFPRGIDTLHGFRRPGWAVPLYHRVVRRLAGYGLPLETPQTGGPLLPALSREVDVAIIGGGVSGRATDAELRARGLDSTLVIDRSPTDPASAELGRTTALFLPPPEPSVERPFTVLASQDGGRAAVVRSRRVVVASGAYDANLLFGGNDRPGVMTADGAFALDAARFRSFRNAIVFGDGPRAISVLERFDQDVAAVVAPGEIGPDLTRVASDRGVPLFPRTLLLRANGRRRVRSVTLRTRSKGERSTVPADAVVLAHRRLPHSQFFFQAGARMRWSPATAAYYPVTDANGATSVPGLYAVGEALGPVDPPIAALSGQRTGAALAMAEPVGTEVGPSAAGPPVHPLESYYRELLPEATGLAKWIACPCEDVLLSEVTEASHRGYRGIEVIKRYTGLGTGLCQGRYCLPDALLVLSILEGRDPSEVGYITQRPPVVPARLDTLGSAVELLAPQESR